MGQNASKIFSQSGGTIGRAPSNDWVLADEEKFISGRHAIIRYMGGMFSLEDVSTNGVFMNGQSEAVGAGNEPVILKSGDRMQIGDYEVYVSIVEGESAAAPEQAPMAMPGPDPVMTSPTGVPTSPPTSPSTVPGSSTMGPMDPLDLLGDAPAPPPSAPAAYPDHSSAMSDHFAPPGPPGGGSPPGAIPDDWDLTDFGGAGRAPAMDVPPPPMAPDFGSTTSIVPPPQGSPGMMPAGSASGSALFDQLMPLVIQGMMDVLKSRAEIKSQFRLALTTIKPVENNPLKFSPNVEDAMHHLFGGAKTGYLGPTEAFEEGFKDIKAHQLAMIAGMRAAFEYMLEQFSPDVLEDQFEGGTKRGKLMGMANKVRYWDMYREMFERITRDSDDNFRRLFGDEFASAYEEQMQKIARNM